jgi:hypothetical protein
MQLVRLGANPTRTLSLSRARDSALKQIFRMAGMDGKSALELAKMTKRTELVELMDQHLRYSAEERARVVHCRCGSRLPWTSCHATGIGHPAHYRVVSAVGGTAGLQLPLPQHQPAVLRLRLEGNGHAGLPR